MCLEEERRTTPPRYRTESTTVLVQEGSTILLTTQLPTSVYICTCIHEPTPGIAEKRRVTSLLLYLCMAEDKTDG